jgi:tetratricopeptide (TPR) repeat protein
MRTAILVILSAAFALQAAPQPADLLQCAKQLDRGDFVAAARDAEAIVRKDSESVAARILLARAYMGLNNGAGALSELHAALQHEPDSLDALYYLSKLTGILSAQAFGAVAELAPDSARMHQIRAETLEAQKDADGAAREYMAALEKRPGTTYILNAMGDLERHEKKYSDALKWYEQVIAKDPGNYDALYGAGASYWLSHQEEKALPFFQNALEADPSSIAAKMALGEALLYAKNGPRAVVLLEEAAKADPQFRRLQFLLGKAYQMVGRPADARIAFERYRRLASQQGAEDLRTLGIVE